MERDKAGSLTRRRLVRMGVAGASVQPWPAVTAIGLVQTELGRAAHAALSGAKAPRRTLDDAARHGARRL